MTKTTIEFNGVSDFAGFVKWRRKGEEATIADSLAEKANAFFENPKETITEQQLIQMALEIKQDAESAREEGQDIRAQMLFKQVSMLTQIPSRFTEYRKASRKNGGVKHMGVYVNT